MDHSKSQDKSPLRVETLPPDGFVRLVSYMQPANPDDYLDFCIDAAQIFRDWNKWTGDLEVVRNARVSFDADFRTGDEEHKDKKLINYMYGNKHTSPFEAMVFTFEISCPLFIARQWQRHRTWSYNEISARYTELPSNCYVPEPDVIGVQSKSNRQARDLSSPGDSPEWQGWSEDVAAAMEESNTAVHELYRTLLVTGVPRELARTILPGATYTRFFGTVDLHNLLHFIRLRIQTHAQWEIQQYARGLLELIDPIVPWTVDAFRKEFMNSTISGE